MIKSCCKSPVQEHSYVTYSAIVGRENLVPAKPVVVIITNVAPMWLAAVGILNIRVATGEIVSAIATDVILIMIVGIGEMKLDAR